MGPQSAIPSVEWGGGEDLVSAGQTFINKEFNFPYTSSKMLIWWLTNQATANGSVYNTNYLLSAITQRCSGDLKEMSLTLNSSRFPSTPLICDYFLENSNRAGINGPILLKHLYRCFNQNSDSNSGGIFLHMILIVTI